VRMQLCPDRERERERERKRGDRAERVKQKCISSDIYEVLSVWCVGIVPFLSFNIPYT